MSVDTTKSVRTILVKSWLDMGKVKIQVAGKTVIIRGRLVKGRSDDDPVNGLFIEQLEQKLMNIREVKFIRWALDDWKHERGQWRPKSE
jgi:hypothetical protein